MPIRVTWQGDADRARHVHHGQTLVERQIGFPLHPRVVQRPIEGDELLAAARLPTYCLHVAFAAAFLIEQTQQPRDAARFEKDGEEGVGGLVRREVWKSGHWEIEQNSSPATYFVHDAN